MAGPRVLSLISSATEILHALGEGAAQVGRSHECDFPTAVLSLPVCSEPAFDVSGNSSEIDRLVKNRVRDALSVYRVFDSELARLEPTHILTQTQCEVCAVSLKDVEAALAARAGISARVVPLSAESLAGVWADVRRVASALDKTSRGEELVASLQARLERVRAGAAGAPRPRVACIEWPEPVMAAGNWVPELVEIAGGENLFGEAGRHSPWMTFDDLLGKDPDAIVAMPCGYDLERTLSEMHWLTGRPEWPRLRAVRENRVFAVDGNQFFNRPGPRLVESAELLAGLFHPDRFPLPQEGAVWARVTAPPALPQRGA